MPAEVIDETTETWVCTDEPDLHVPIADFEPHLDDCKPCRVWYRTGPFDL